MTPGPGFAKAFAQYGITIDPAHTSGRLVQTAEKAVVERITGGQPGKLKVVQRDFEEAEDTSSSTDLQEIEKQHTKAALTDKEKQRESFIKRQVEEYERNLCAFIKRQVEEYERKLRSHKEISLRAEPGVAKSIPNPVRKGTTRAITVNDRVENPKKGRYERESKTRVFMEKAISTAWTLLRLRRSLFSETVLSDPLPAH